MAPNKFCDRCCNPFGLNNHRKCKSLRPASENICEKWKLKKSDYLCSNCRNRLMKTNPTDQADADTDNDAEPPIQIEPSASSSGLSPPLSQISQLSVEIRLPAINEALQLLEESPIPKKKLKSSADTWAKAKVDKVCHNLSKSLGAADESEFVSQQDAKDLFDVIYQLKTKFHAEETSRAKKIQILTLMPPDWSVEKIAAIMDSSKYLVKQAKKLAKTEGILSIPGSKSGRSLPEDTKSKILEFYIDDRVSTNMPGMKDYISVRNDEGKKVHVQKRLILSNLKELYEYFRTENPDIQVGFSMFATLRPKQCVLAGASGTHTVCVCSIHQNVKLMMLGCNLKALTHDQEHPLQHYDDCIDLIICKNPDQECYLGSCKNCPNLEILQNIIIDVLDKNDIEEVSYKHWVSKPRTSLETSIKCSLEFAEEFCAKMKMLLPHSFVAKEQAKFMKQLKESLESDEFLVICDFAENYAFVVQDAAPGFHWNNNQATIYPIVVYYRENDTVNHKSLVIISDCLIHDAIAVYVYSQIINDFVKTISQQPAKIYYFSDGAPQQFKNFKNFVNLYHHKNDFGVPAEWNFFATAHGKGPCDGIGGTLKRMAARASLQLPPHRQITTPEELYDWASIPTNFPSIGVKFSPMASYNRAKDFLLSRFESGKRVPATQKIHRIIPHCNGIVHVKNTSASEKFEAYNIIKSIPNHT